MNGRQKQLLRFCRIRALAVAWILVAFAPVTVDADGRRGSPQENGVPQPSRASAQTPAQDNKPPTGAGGNLVALWQFDTGG